MSEDQQNTMLPPDASTTAQEAPQGATANGPVPSPAQSSEPPKRRRGRPPKNPALQEQSVTGSSATPGEQKRGPGRPKKNAGPQYSQEDTLKLAKQLQGLHVIAAQATGLPELMISDTESVLLADSVAKVSEEYGLSLSGKTGAMLQLLGTAAIIYMPRFASINQKIKAKKAAQVTDAVIIPKNDNPT